MWMILDDKSSTPLKNQIYTKMKELILSETFVSGEKMPSTRALAKELRVSRNTILEVYDQLTAEGYLIGIQGSGTVVASGIRKPSKLIHSPMNHSTKQNKSESKDIIDFRSGTPDLNYFPRREWAKLYYNVCIDLPSSAFNYTHPAGVRELRHAISKYLNQMRGISCSPDNIMIVSGSTQGLSLISQLLFTDKKEVIVEDPLHHGLLNVISAAGYTITALAADDKGMNTNLLQPSDRISFIYTTPSHQYPLGGILPIQRRLSLIEYASDNDCYIIEDDYDSEFRYEGQPVNSLYELNSEKVIYIGSFSKILAPALRLGFLLLPTRLIPAYLKLKMYSDLHTEVISQHVLSEFMKSGGFDKHIWKMKKIYSRKREHLLKELYAHFPDEFVLKGQAAGLHIVIQFYNIIFTEKLICRIQSSLIKIYPVENYALQNLGNHQSEILLGYAHLSMEDITKGIQILSKILHSPKD